jgi:hypothetical protein
MFYTSTITTSDKRQLPITEDFFTHIRGCIPMFEKALDDSPFDSTFLLSNPTHAILAFGQDYPPVLTSVLLALHCESVHQQLKRQNDRQPTP